jgi:hypothetical protein
VVVDFPVIVNKEKKASETSKKRAASNVLRKRLGGGKRPNATLDVSDHSLRLVIEFKTTFTPSSFYHKGLTSIDMADDNERDMNLFLSHGY